MDNYKESTIPITEDETVQDLRYQLKNLSTSETRNYFQNLFMPDDQSPQSIANELDTYLILIRPILKHHHWIGGKFMNLNTQL